MPATWYYTLTNNGIIWKGTLVNGPTGQINDGGFITSSFTNKGTLNVANQWTIINAFTNSATGYINVGDSHGRTNYR